MDQSEQAVRFQTELRALISRYAQEYDILSVIVIGIMQVEADRISAQMNQIQFKPPANPTTPDKFP